MCSRVFGVDEFREPDLRAGHGVKWSFRSQCVNMFLTRMHVNVSLEVGGSDDKDVEKVGPKRRIERCPNMHS